MEDTEYYRRYWGLLRGSYRDRPPPCLSTRKVGRAADESQVTHYAIYWGSSEQVTLEPFVQVPKGSGGGSLETGLKLGNVRNRLSQHMGIKVDGRVSS